jgi:DNA-binding ferritin-like protein
VKKVLFGVNGQSFSTDNNHGNAEEEDDQIMDTLDELSERLRGVMKISEEANSSGGS